MRNKINSITTPFTTLTTETTTTIKQDATDEGSTEATTRETTERTTPVIRTTLDTRPPDPSLDRNLSRVNSAECGLRTALNLRITLGDTAQPGQFPWAVSLLYRAGAGPALPLCGAALLSPRHALTAAHCDTEPGGYKLVSARVGQTDLAGPVAAPGQEVAVRRVVKHPAFTRSPVAVMDIALVELQHSVTISDFVRPICLHHPAPGRVEQAAEFTVAGWGRTERARSADLLQFTRLQKVSRAVCQVGRSDITLNNATGQPNPTIVYRRSTARRGRRGGWDCWRTFSCYPASCVRGAGAGRTAAAGTAAARSWHRWCRPRTGYLVHFVLEITAGGTGLVSGWSGQFRHPAVRLLPTWRLHQDTALPPLDTGHDADMKPCKL